MRPPWPALAVGTLLAGLAFWTLVSTGWAASAEDAYAEFGRTLLYLAVFALVAVVATRSTAGAWAGGLAAGIAAIGILALASRLFPRLVDSGDLETLLPTAHARLSWPVNYWNGLAAFVALGFPLLLRLAVSSRSLLTRGAALAPLPVLASAIYLASSRGGALAAVAGTVVFVAAVDARWRAAAAVALATLGSLLAVAVLRGRSSVVNPVVGAGPDAAEGHRAALLIALICVTLGVVWAAASLAHVRPPSAAAGRALAGVAIVALAGLIALSHPVRRLQHFKQPPVVYAKNDTDYVQSHLFSSNGSGRWQFWHSAVDEFRSTPLKGRGAGSYQAWWAQHGSLGLFVRDAHSLYLEQLGELGLVGLGLLLAAFGAGFTAWLWRLRRLTGETRSVAAGVGAAFVGYALAAGIDWLWELPAVSAVGIACLALMTGAATSAADQPVSSVRPRRPVRIAAVAVSLALIVAELIPLLRDRQVTLSREAVRRGDTRAALAAARRARDIEPWAATPYVQLALVEEQAGRLAPAERRIGEAIERNELDWRLWLVQARIQTKRGEIAAARRSLDRARELNPRSPLLRPNP